MSVFGEVVISRIELIKITKQIVFYEGCAEKLKKLHRNILS